MGHAIRMWSVVFSEVAYSQFGEPRPHLCMDEWNHSTPVCMQLHLTQAVWNKPNATDLELVMGMKAQSLDVLLQHSSFHIQFVH